VRWRTAGLSLFIGAEGGGQLMVKAEEWLALMGDEMACPLVVLYSVE
jgi:hypothetical protein